MITSFHVCFAPAISPPAHLRQSPQQYARFAGPQQGSLRRLSSIFLQIFALFLYNLFRGSPSRSNSFERQQSEQQGHQFLCSSAAAGRHSSAGSADDHLLCSVLYLVWRCGDESVSLCQQQQQHLFPSADSTERTPNCSSTLCHKQSTKQWRTRNSDYPPQCQWRQYDWRF